MSLWEFAAVLGGLAQFHGADQAAGREEFDEAAAWLDAHVAARSTVH